MENPVYEPSILYVDDEAINLTAFRRAFSSDYRVETCLSGEEALQILTKEDFPLVIVDQRMPGMSGIELCERLIELKPEAMRMILTAFTETDMLLDAIRRGHVHDYIVKPWRKQELKPLLDQAFLDHKQRLAKLRQLEAKAAKADRLEEEISDATSQDAIIGIGRGLKEVMETVRRAAPTPSTMLLLGETGTGKGVLARSIHQLSKNCGGPFVSVHCAAIVRNLLESELFGHERGSFTGAEQTRIGRFEQAKGGTLFLDEIGEISEETQVKLLRVLQERQIERVGGNKTIQVDVRVVAATHRDLEKEVREGKFREDLYYRLNVIAVQVPPLRERREDIPELAGHFLEKYRRRIGRQLTLSEQAMDHLCKYDWPGNVRELENILERAMILSPGPAIEPEDLNLRLEEILQAEKVEPEKLTQLSGTLREQIQKEGIQELATYLTQAKGNVAEAARMMGVPRTTLFHRLKKHKLI